MDRRAFLASSSALVSAAVAARPAAAPAIQAERAARFKLKYAPHFGMFRHHAGEDPIDQLKFMADEGFPALEDNGMARRDVGLQSKIGEELGRLGMEMGVFVAHAQFGEVTFAKNDGEMRARLKGEMEKAVEVQKRVNARWCTVVPGAFDQRLAPEYQMANVIDNLRACCEVCEPAGLTMVLEPLNWLTNHPGVYLTGMPQAYAICRAVDSPSCKILDDLYHQQITEGNLIPNLDKSWSEIGYIQVGDNPGRKEPTTGEINYAKVFAHLASKGFDGIVGMEHGNSRGGKEGERAVIEAYRACDPT